MRPSKILFVVSLLAMFAGSAKAWNCDNPLASRVDVGPTKPAGASAGDGDGQYYIGSDASNPKDYYVCQVPKTNDPTSGQKQKQQQSANSNSTSNSSASNTLKNKVQATGGDSSSTATGGSSVLKNAGNSTLANSGNSSNTNTNAIHNTSQGGAGGSASSTTASTASAANNGNGSNNTSYDSNTNVEASKIPVATAIALAPPSNLNCSLGYGAGVQTSGVGASVAFSKVDKNCAALTTALVGRNRLTFCKVYITNKYAKQAHVTLEDCLQQDAAPVPVSVPVVPPAPQPTPINVTVTIPPITPAPPVIQASEEQYKLIGTCTIPTHSNGCKRIIDQAIQSHARALRVVGPSDATFVAEYLRSRHSSIRLEQRLSDDQNSTVSVYLLFGQESVNLGE